jgi:hypothetical protein
VWRARLWFRRQRPQFGIPIVMEFHLAIGIIETRRDRSRSVSAVSLRLCSHPKLTKEDAGSRRMFQRRNLEIRIKRWRQLNTKRKRHAVVGDVFKTSKTSVFEIRILHQGAG